MFEVLGKQLIFKNTFNGAYLSVGAAADMTFCCGLCERNKEVASWHLGLRRYPIGNHRKANSVGSHGPGQTCVLVIVLSWE